MNKLDDHKPFMALLLRSPDVGDGWRNVSGVLEAIVSEHAKAAPELFEIARRDDKMQVRLTQRGALLADYI